MRRTKRNLIAVAGVIGAVIGLTIAIPSFLTGNHVTATLATILVVIGLVLLAIALESKMLTRRVKKNLLDLKYNTYLQYYNTCIILFFTYLTAVFIGFVTRKINYRNHRNQPKLHYL